LPGINKPEPYAASQILQLPIFTFPKTGHHLGGILGGVDRFYPLPTAAHRLAVTPFRFHLLDVAAVRQHDLAEIRCGFCRPDGRHESLPYTTAEANHYGRYERA
jgi:hypothetical protein